MSMRYCSRNPCVVVDEGAIEGRIRLLRWNSISRTGIETLFGVGCLYAIVQVPL
jgi:hypothetical protein